MAGGRRRPPIIDDLRLRPVRRDVDWFATHDAPIQPMLETLDFARGNKNWGYQLRFGLFAVSDDDIRTIAQAMGVSSLAKAA